MENRSFCADLVEVSWPEDGRMHHRVANLEDISAAGVCLMLESPLPVGCEVSVSLDGSELLGVVRHCTEGQAGFLVGLGFHPGCEWSLEDYRPRHYLDPQDLFSFRDLAHKSESNEPDITIAA